MLIHHGASDTYAQTASTAAREARGKLEALIEHGRARAARVIEHVQQHQPTDRLVTAGSLRFSAPFETEDDGVTIAVGFGDVEERLHRNALQQAAERVGLPLSYITHLSEPERRGWGRDLIAYNMTECHRRLFGDREDRVLVRSVGGETRAMLSDRYRRLDSPVIIESFAKAAGEMGAVPVEGYALDTRIAIKAILPMVFEPVPHEVLAMGVAFETSDYGAAALTVRTFILRLACSNGLIVDNALRQVHLGRKLTEGYAFSEQTYRLDTAATASAIADIVRAQLAFSKVDELQRSIRAANESHVSPREVEAFLKKQMSKAEAQAVKNAFSSADVINMPPGQSTWRLAQAISWVAGQMKDEERKLDMMRTAGLLLAKAA